MLRQRRDHLQNSMRQTGTYLAWKQLMEGKGYTVLELYEHEVFDFTNNGTGAEILRSLLEPYDVEWMEPGTQPAPVDGAEELDGEDGEEDLDELEANGAPR